MKALSDKFDVIISKLSEINQETSDNAIYRSSVTVAIDAAKTKLDKYLSPIGQPGLNFIKLVRIFDPMKARYLNLTINDLKSLPRISSISNDQEKFMDLKFEYQSYINDLKREPLLERPESLFVFWSENHEKYPILSKIALCYLSIPISSAQVERSFSILKKIITPERQSLTVQNLKILVFLYFNNFLPENYII